MTELEQYREIAVEPLKIDSPNDIIDYMDRATRASSKLREWLTEAQHSLSVREHELRKGLSQYEYPENRMKKEIEGETLEELSTVNVLESLLVSLDKRFKTAQSALSYLKTEMSMR